MINQCHHMTANDKPPVARIFRWQLLWDDVVSSPQKIGFLEKTWCIIIISGTSIAN